MREKHFENVIVPVTALQWVVPHCNGRYGGAGATQSDQTHLLGKALVLAVEFTFDFDNLRASTTTRV